MTNEKDMLVVSLSVHFSMVETGSLGTIEMQEHWEYSLEAFCFVLFFFK